MFLDYFRGFISNDESFDIIGFETSRCRFSPPATKVICRTGFLKPKDLKRFDELINVSVNGMFFHREYCAKRIIQDIFDLRKRREMETHKEILDCIIYELNSMNNASGIILRDDVKRRFNVLESPVDCFAIPLQQVLLTDDNSCTIFSKVKSSLFELDSLFSFDNIILRESFKFKSPFGSVASIENINYAIDDLQNEKSPSLVIAKHVYSEQEASAKLQEEKVLFTYFIKMENLIDDWSLTKQGIRSVNAEVSQRSKNINFVLP